MDPGIPKTTTEVRALTRMVQYYSDMWTMHFHVLTPLSEVGSDPNGIK